MENKGQSKLCRYRSRRACSADLGKIIKGKASFAATVAAELALLITVAAELALLILEK